MNSATIIFIVWITGVVTAFVILWKHHTRHYCEITITDIGWMALVAIFASWLFILAVIAEQVHDIVIWRRPMTDKERYDYVNDSHLECVKSVDTVRNGSGCKVHRVYRFDYVPNDGEPFYRKLGGNEHNDEVYISDKELLHNFKRLERQ